MNAHDIVYVLVAAGLIGIGIYGVLVAAHLLRKILALNVLGASIFLMLVTLGARDGRLDPVSQAMVLTGIVVAVSATAFALNLLLALYRRSGNAALDGDQIEGDGE